MNYCIRCLSIFVVLLLSGCATSVPEGITPVDGFQLQRYLGTWYEVARMDHKFERGLSQVTATYETLPDGSVKVINRGYSEKKQKIKTAIGKAKIVGDASVGHLKVSFFGPFYGSYVVLDLAEDYSSALVGGPNREYLWILSRTSKMEENRLKELTGLAESLGYDLSELIMVDQSRAADRG